MIDRYALPAMRALWSEQAKFERWLRVEQEVARAQAALKIIPADAARRIAGARFRIARIAAIEARTRHDVIAFLKALEPSIGSASRYLHFGLTSYDVVDTALALGTVQACREIEDALARLERALRRCARRYRATPMIGRTHGVHAQPITFGLKCLSWAAETGRNRARVAAARAEIGFGKISGAVGTYANLAPAVERRALARLGLKPEPVATQVIPRDRHAFLVSVLALVAAGLERTATEIRNLQHTEIGEVAEPFAAGQRGSSAMPHKRNPVTCEQISGLARVVRGYVIPALENVNLWHERDISNSSAERVIIPDATTLVHYMVERMTRVIAGLDVYPARMAANLAQSGNQFFSETLMLELVRRGMAKDRAYTLVQRIAFDARQAGADFLSCARRNAAVRRRIPVAEFAALFRLDAMLGNVPAIYRREGL